MLCCSRVIIHEPERRLRICHVQLSNGVYEKRPWLATIRPQHHVHALVLRVRDYAQTVDALEERI
jgi:hypothetical protein